MHVLAGPSSWHGNGSIHNLRYNLRFRMISQQWARVFFIFEMKKDRLLKQGSRTSPAVLRASIILALVGLVWTGYRSIEHVAPGFLTILRYRSCELEEHAEYDGRVVRDGSSFKTNSAQQCQDACNKEEACNVWVWCGGATADGCGWGREYQECWLKHASRLNAVQPGVRQRGEHVPWVSGTCVAPEQRAAAERERSAKLDAERKRLSKLKNDKRLPLVWFDIEIKKKRVGRIEMVLFTDVSPRSAENFRQLVTGEAGVVPKGKEGEGKPLHFRGAKFYRIIHKFIDQAGIDVPSVYGGEFKDDAGGLKLKHVHKGLLSMANMGPNTNTAHFSIMMGPSPHLDGHYTIFGQVVQGFDVIDAINNLSIGKPDNTATAEEEVVIVNCGQDRQGTITAMN